MLEQLSIFPELRMDGCGICLCRDCLKWWSDRCPHGGCYDDLRAQQDPYDKAHPGDPPRTGWSNWRSDQAYWCRGGVTFPTHVCAGYTHYEGSVVKECLCANVQEFQDGYIACSIVETVGCTECYRRFEDRLRREGVE